jgi:hypothetical protein
MSTAPKDPLPFKLNPLLPVSDEAIAVARNVFPEAKAFLTLFDSSFVVVHDQAEAVCDHKRTRFPFHLTMLLNYEASLLLSSSLYCCHKCSCELVDKLLGSAAPLPGEGTD